MFKDLLKELREEDASKDLKEKKTTSKKKKKTKRKKGKEEKIKNDKKPIRVSEKEETLGESEPILELEINIFYNNFFSESK